MSDNNVKISALAIVYNEEHNIREYLDNMAFANEIVVVDSYSNDDTVEIIRQEYPHVRFYQRVFDDFSSQRNYALDLSLNDWVVFFDADERVSEKGIQEILATINSTTDKAAYWFKRKFYYKGKPLVNNKFNYDKAIRLLRVSKCRYSEKLVHETIETKGKTGILKESIDHYSFKSKEDFLLKRLQYSQLKAKELYKKGVKTNLYHITVRPAYRFFKYYILGTGFLNGQRGFEIARILGYHVYMRYMYLNELNNPYKKPKILVIQQKMIGDVLASSIICNNLKYLYPDSDIQYSVYPFTKPVVENNPNINKILPFNPEYRNNKFAFFKYLWQIRRTNYDIVIDAYGILESNLMVAFSSAKRKIGFYKPYSSILYTDTVTELKTPHTKAGLALDNRTLLVKVLNPSNNFDSKPKIYITEEEIEKGREILSQNNIDTAGKIYMISVLGSNGMKTYPSAYMAGLLDTIAQNSDATLIFNYIPSQNKEAEEIFNLCSAETKKKIRTDVIPGTIRDFLSVLYHCTALIGNEGGAVNMAKAINVPTFTIFSTWIKKEAWNSFEDGKQNVSVHLKDFKPELYGKKSPKEMKPQALELYKQFTPDYIIPPLKEYIKIN